MAELPPSSPADSSPADSRPADHRPFSRALLVAVMVTVLYGAILLAVDAMISLIADRNVVVEPDAGPLVGPIMAFAALCAVFVSVLSGLRPTPGRTKIPAARAIVTGLVVSVLSPAVGAIVYVFGLHQLLTGMDFFVKYLASPFVLASALLAIITVLLLPAIARARSRAR